MDNSPHSNQPQWNPQPQPSNAERQAAWTQPQYGQQAWQSPSTNYMPPQYAQNMPGQYNVPQYAQPQQQTNNFLMHWLMMGIAVRIVLLIVVPLLLCGGCALVAILSSIGR